MKKPIVKSTLFGLILTVSQMANAHPGHDNNHWTSDSLHLLSFAVAVLIGGVVYKIRSRRKKHIGVKS